MAITEPTTLVTDYVLALLSGALSLRLFASNGARSRAVALWAAALAAAAAASLAGGTYHGFGPALPPEIAALLWKATTLAMGAASFLLVAAAVVASFIGAARRALIALAAAKLAAYTWWMLGHDEFRWVICDYGSALAAVLVLVAAGRVQGAPGWRSPLAAGILATIAAAAVQQSGFDLHRHFNHNDLMHVVQMGAVWLLYRGGGALGDAA